MWWQTLTLVQKIYFCIACPATVFLVVQIVMMLIGLGGDSDIDSSGVDLTGDGNADINVDTDSGLSLFTTKSLTAFFTIGGWVGFTLGDGKMWVAIVVSLVAGAAALVIVALILKWLLRMQSSGNVKLESAIGKIAEVYLTIPAKNGGEGKITVTINESLNEYGAIQEGDEPIKTGSKVKIVRLSGNAFVVEKAE